MNILIGMECSGVIRSRFRDAGNNAWSCDLKKSEDNSPHHKIGDIYSTLCTPAIDKWDLVILHPECTALTVAGNHVYAQGKTKWMDRVEAVNAVDKLWEVAKKHSKRVCLENPQGVLSTMSVLGRPQYVQPYQFGHDASKKTGLWLWNLPPLIPTSRFPGRIVNGKERWSNQTDSGQNKLGPSPTRATERARTYSGIADAMVCGWGDLNDS